MSNTIRHAKVVTQIDQSIARGVRTLESYADLVGEYHQYGDEGIEDQMVDLMADLFHFIKAHRRDKARMSAQRLPTASELVQRAAAHVGAELELGDMVDDDDDPF